MTHVDALTRIEKSGIVGPAHGNLSRVKSLVESEGELIDAMNSIDASAVDETPQGAAAHTHSKEIVQYFLEKGVNLDIFMAAAIGSAEDVLRLLSQSPFLANARGAHGIPLIAHAGSKETAEALVENGVQCDVFMAATFGLSAHVAKLLAADESLKHARNTQGVYPTQLAAMSGHKDVIRALLEGGAEDPDRAGKQFLEGDETVGDHWRGHYFHNMNLSGSVFNNVNLGGSVVHNANMKGTVIFNVNLTNAIIDWATIDGLKISGVEVKPLIDAELKKRR